MCARKVRSCVNWESHIKNEQSGRLLGRKLKRRSKRLKLWLLCLKGSSASVSRFYIKQAS